MTSISVASSHQKSRSKLPTCKLVARLATNATRDREADQQHHPRLAVARISCAAPLQERDPAIDEDDDAEDRRDPAGARRRVCSRSRSANMPLNATTGTDSAKLNQNRSRN